MSMFETVLVVAATLVGAWVLFVGFVFVTRPDDTSIRDAVRLLPDTARLVRRLAVDRSIPRRTRWLVWLLLAYLASPLDLVPDFVPVIGFADDAIVTSLVLRHVIRRAGAAKVREHWSGSEEGLASFNRLLRLPDPTSAAAT
jgi:uncharacterized membrane protein YkvA (DUF1232 family)